MAALCVLRVEPLPSGQPLIRLTMNPDVNGPGAETETRHLGSTPEAVAAVDAFLRAVTAPVPGVDDTATSTTDWGEVEGAIHHLEDLLRSVGQDADTRDLDPLLALQRQQQCLDLMSTLNRFLEDITVALIEARPHPPAPSDPGEHTDRR